MNKKYYITVLIIIILIVMVLITGVLLSKKEKQENASDELQTVEESKDENTDDEDIYDGDTDDEDIYDGDTDDEDIENENNTELEEIEIAQFNLTFKQYEGRIMGESVIELLDKLIVNALTYGDSDEKLPDVIYIDGRTDGQITKDDVEGSEFLSNSEMEEVEIAEFDKENAQFIVRSDSDSPNGQAIGRIRKIIEGKHYYNVYFTNNDITGLIEYVFIEE